MGTHKDLEVWNRSILLVKDIYQLTGTFPRHETCGLTSQIRKAVISVPASISKGSGRRTSREFHHFLRISSGSISELETLLIVANQLEYLKKSDFEAIQVKVKLISWQISRLMNSISNKIKNHTKPMTA